MEKLTKQISAIVFAAITTTTMTVTASAACRHDNTTRTQTTPYGYQSIPHTYSYADNAGYLREGTCNATQISYNMVFICSDCGANVKSAGYRTVQNHPSCGLGSVITADVWN